MNSYGSIPIYRECSHFRDRQTAECFQGIADTAGTTENGSSQIEFPSNGNVPI